MAKTKYQRSVTATIHNMTKEDLIFQKINPSDGEANISSKEKNIKPGGHVNFLAYSDSIFSGTQGVVEYSSDSVQFTIKWENPYGPWNDTHYSLECTNKDEYFLFCKVDDSHDATVDYYIYDILRLTDLKNVNLIDKDTNNTDIVFSKDTPCFYNDDNIVFNIDNVDALVNKEGSDKIKLSINVEYKLGFFETYKEIPKNDTSELTKGILEFTTNDIIEGYTYTLEINEKVHNFAIDNGINFLDDKDFKGSLTVGKEYKQRITIQPSEQDVSLTFDSLLKNANTNEISKNIQGLPLGLNISATDPFTIVGVPSQSGQYDVTVTAIRASDGARAVKHLSMSVIYDKMDIILKEYGVDNVLSNNVDIYSERMFACEIVVSNGYPPYTISVKNEDVKKPALPVGIELWGEFIIGATETKNEQYIFDAVITDRYGNLATKRFTFNVIEGVKIFPDRIDAMDITNLPDITLTSKVKDKVVDFEGLKYHLSDDSSTFFKIKDDKLEVQNNVVPGVYMITVLLTNRPEYLQRFILSRRNYLITVGKKLNLSKKDLPRGQVDVHYNGEIEIDGNSPSNYPKGISLIIPNLPPGLYLSPDFKIVGVPSTSGIFTIDVVAADIISKKDFGCFSYKITIDGPPVAKNIRNRTFPAGKISIPLSDYISSTIDISGGTCVPGPGSKVEGKIDSKGMLQLNIPYNTVGDVVLSYRVENKFGKSNVALVQFFVHE